jgi:adenylate kinase family enzyme
LLLSKIKLDIVFQLDVPKSFLIDGIIHFDRRSCVKCGTTYSDFDMPKSEGICDKCGGELIKRMSDSLERVKTRLDIYEKEINSFLPDLEALGILTVLPITVDNSIEIDAKYLKKLKDEVFWVQTDDGGKGRMLNYEGMRKRLYNVLAEKFM